MGRPFVYVDLALMGMSSTYSSRRPQLSRSAVDVCRVRRCRSPTPPVAVQANNADSVATSGVGARSIDPRCGRRATWY